MEDEPAVLVAEIEEAFSKWLQPDDCCALRPEAIGASNFERLQTCIIGRKWDALKIGHVAYFDTLALYLTPVGYRYYLPGLMRLSLQNPEIYDLPAYIADALTPPQDKRRLEQWRRDYRDPFSDQQQDTIRRYLIWANARFEGGSESESVGKALSRGWTLGNPESQ